MKKQILVIVESNAKCGKIQEILGNNYIVKACMGHIINIDKSKGLKAVNVNNNYDTKYKIIEEKKKYLLELKKISKNVKEIIIASDLDREGEAIGYHLMNELKLNINSTKRIVFNEISKKAILFAINNPRTLNIDMVNAQKTRQILDYLIGFTISPLLWKFFKNNTSAGRCQSTCLHLLNEKEKNVNDFKSKSFYSFNGLFLYKNVELSSSIGTKFNENESLELLNEFKNAEFKIGCIKNNISVRNPPAPYITTSIQQDASNSFNLPPKITMKYLQQMYEKGLITYMRTDSCSISEDCSKKIRELINTNYGNNYYKYHEHKNKTQNAQEAHECIRPVDVSIVDLEDDVDINIKKLYNIIWKRTVASHMKELKTKIYTINIINNKNKINFISKLEHPIFLGFKKIYNEVCKDDSETINVLKANDAIEFINIISGEKFSNPPVRYNESSLIKDLEKRGIGRPSTYSNIIDTLFKRDYIEKKDDNGKTIKVNQFLLKSDKIIYKNNIDYTMNKQKNKLFITDLGDLIDKFMSTHFKNIINYDFTKDLENDLDSISIGKRNFTEVIDKLYKALLPEVTKLKNQSSDKEILWKEKKNKKLIGMNDNKEIYYYKSKYGNVIEQENKIIGLDNNKNLSDIDLNICINLFKLPIKIGDYNKNEIYLYYGCYGFYIKYNTKNYTVKTDSLDFKSVNQDYCIELIKNTGKKLIKKLSDKMYIYDGKYGPYVIKYIKNKKPKIASIPKNKIDTINNLTFQECNKLLNK